MSNKKNPIPFSMPQTLYEQPGLTCSLLYEGGKNYTATIKMLIFGTPCTKVFCYSADNPKEAQDAAFSFVKECEDEYRERYDTVKDRLKRKIMAHTLV